MQLRVVVRLASSLKSMQPLTDKAVLGIVLAGIVTVCVAAAALHAVWTCLKRPGRVSPMQAQIADAKPRAAPQKMSRKERLEHG